MKVVFIGCVEFSRHMLTHLLTLKDVEIAGVVTREQSSFNADFRPLRDVAEAEGIPYYIARKNEQSSMPQWIRAFSPDIVYCFGWSSLLNKEVLDIPRLGVVGYHPAALPRNRGRHPIVWALALGLKETASTFFFMDEGADSGDILDQRKIVIKDEDDAFSVYQKLIEISKEQLTELTAQLASGHQTRIKQNHSLANYWRKRNKADGQIDWRMSSRSIYNLVRALTKPYVGAHCVVDGKEVKVWKCMVVDSDFIGYENIEPGKVLDSDEEEITVKCGEGAVRLIDLELEALGSIYEKNIDCGTASG